MGHKIVRHTLLYGDDSLTYSLVWSWMLDNKQTRSEHGKIAITVNPKKWYDVASHHGSWPVIAWIFFNYKKNFISTHNKQKYRSPYVITFSIIVLSKTVQSFFKFNNSHMYVLKVTLISVDHKFIDSSVEWNHSDNSTSHKSLVKKYVSSIKFRSYNLQ